MSAKIHVEFPASEAESLLKRVGNESMSAAECDAAQAGEERLKRAIAIERNPGGAAHAPPEYSKRDLYAEACSLVGDDVRIVTTYGQEKIGRLDHMRSFSTLILETGPHSRQPVPLSCIESIAHIVDPVEQKVAA